MRHRIVITLASSILATASVMLAQDINCSYTSSSFTTVNGNLVVPDNATCQLLGSGKVTGNVTVGENAGLVLEGGWTVGGYLQATDCAYVALNPYGSGSTVVGFNIRIENCSGNSPAIGAQFQAGTAFGSFGPSSLIGGSLQCLNNGGPCVLTGDHVGGSVNLKNNISSVPSQLDGNFIAKSLHCDKNVPAPSGSGNLVAGNPDNITEGQCIDF